MLICGKKFQKNRDKLPCAIIWTCAFIYFLKTVDPVRLYCLCVLTFSAFWLVNWDFITVFWLVNRNTTYTMSKKSVMIFEFEVDMSQFTNQNAENGVYCIGKPIFDFIHDKVYREVCAGDKYRCGSSIGPLTSKMTFSCHFESFLQCENFWGEGANTAAAPCIFI